MGSAACVTGKIAADPTTQPTLCLRHALRNVGLQDPTPILERQFFDPNSSPYFSDESDALMFDYVDRAIASDVVRRRGTILLAGLLIVMQMTAGGALAEGQKNSALQLLLGKGQGKP